MVTVPACVPATSAPQHSSVVAMAAVRLSPASVPGGAGSTVTVTLTCPTSKALSITLRGFPGTRVPATLKVAAGKAAASAPIATATRKKAVRGWIIATLGGTSKRALLTIGVTPRICPPALGRVTLPAVTYANDYVTFGVRLQCAAASSVRITLASSQASMLALPATVTISKYYSAANLVLLARGTPAAPTSVRLQARLGRVSKSSVITVEPTLSSFSVCNSTNTTCYSTGNGPAWTAAVPLEESGLAGFVQLGGWQSINTTVHLRSTSSLIGVPSAAIVAEWDNRVEFPITVKAPKTTPAGTTLGTIIATVGRTTLTVTLTVA
jgi:hypothetical protein